jgi:hypothetical protein
MRRPMGDLNTTLRSESFASTPWRLMVDLKAASDPALWAQFRALASSRPIAVTPEQQRQQDARAEARIDALNRATGFQVRAAGLRTLTGSLKILIGLERQALGLDRKSTSDHGTGRNLSDVERAARIMSILDRARRARDAAGGDNRGSAGIQPERSRFPPPSTSTSGRNRIAYGNAACPVGRGNYLKLTVSATLRS